MALNALAPVPVILLCIFVVSAHYLLALADTIFIVVLMEVRIQASSRSSRGWLFAIHIASSILFLCSLLAVIFLAHPSWLLFILWGSLLVQVSSGAIYFYRGIQLHLNRAGNN